LNGDLPRAETALQQSLDINRRTRGADHPNTAINLHDLALIAIMHGDYAKADAELRQVLAMQKKALGERHPVVAMTLNSLAHVLRDEHREEEAEAAQREALAIARAALGAVISSSRSTASTWRHCGWPGTIPAMRSRSSGLA
jgi:hypothetical protein